MRDERFLVGLVLFHTLAAVPGLALLYALGLLRLRPLALLGAAGPAVLLGIALVGIPLIMLVVLGVSVGLGAALIVMAVVTLVLVLVAVGTRERRPVPVEATGAPGTLVEFVAERVVLAGTALYLLIGAPTFRNLETLWDDANIWSLKALGLYHQGTLVDGLANNPPLSGVHLDYPLLQPMTEATLFHAIGAVDLRFWHVELWVLMALAIWTVAWLLAPLGPRWPWTVVLATLALSGVVSGNITLGDADLLMAALVGCATLAFGIWLQRGGLPYALLGGLLLAAAANVKNEGLVFGTAIGIALVAAAALGHRPGRWRDLAIAAGLVVISVLPWQIWVGGNDAATRNTPSPWQVIDDPSYLIDRLDNLWRGLGQVIVQLMNTAEWSLLAPAFLVCAVTMVVVGRARTLAAFYLLAGFLAYLSVAYVYWVTPIQDIGGFEQRTGARIVLGVVFVGGAGLAHLLQIAAAAWTVPEREVAPGQRPAAAPVASSVEAGGIRSAP
jgi:hypothetical protein